MYGTSIADRQTRRAAVAWGVPFAAALIVLGPALLPGSLFNLDLVLVPRLDIPNGFWGLGPELPRRLPLWVPISLLSPVVPATLSGKVLMVAVFVLAWVGMARLAATLGVRWVQVAGALYALSPFVLTRTAVGHFMVTVPLALLPWVLPTLLRPGRDLGRTFLAAVLLSLGGHFGGSIAVMVVVVAIVAGERARWAKALLIVLAGQAAWLVPAVAVATAGSANLASGAVFGTDAAGPAGLLRLGAGGGFWNSYYQIGGSRLAPAVCGAALLALMAYGVAVLPRWCRAAMVTLAIVGFVIPAATTMTGFSSLLDWFTGTTVGAVWREPQRVLVVYLVVMAPTAVLGAQRAHDRATASADHQWAAGGFAAIPAVVAVLLVAPGVWGIGGLLRAERLPDGWNEARAIVRDDPGTVLALPWYQYYNQQFGKGPVRRVLNPMPLFLGGDVLAASDNGLEDGVQERTDPREPTADRLVEGLVDHGRAIGDDLAALGVRWVVLQKTVHVEDYAGLRSDPGLAVSFDDDSMAVYEVRAWAGEATTDRGAAVDVDGRTPAFARFSTDEALIWNHPASGGWRRGGRPADTTPDGRLHFGAGGGTVWNVATPLALAAQAATVAAVVGVVVARRRRRPPKSDT